ncbi:uncharacterized protein [Lepeophtheirus salmonis]|uniref:uncharacterized protein n=1 Tax=Lepeophtheirus salmonis TaxID=72036 RepID=UPI001AEAE65C|nr:uncharacterized protein LOC121114734 [Lepeophtheirus salmonis]
MTRLQLIFVLFLLNIILVWGESKDRDGRLSLFSVVSFDNTECTSSDTSARCGTCYSSSECAEKGGRAAGNCAAGFGVCCLFIVDTCGSTISRNNSYFRSPGFPTAFTVTAATACAFTIQRCQSNICSIRLDFENLITSEPADGACGANNFDKITITSPSGFSPPGPGGLCGDGLSGQHMYVDTTLAGAVTFNVQAGTAAIANRAWNIKVTQIACDDMNRPPQGCTQYFTGPSGSIKSYNFDGGQINDGHLYSNCIRQEEGFCSIDYSAVGDNDFLLKAATAIKSQDAAIAIDCQETSVVIPTVLVPAAPPTLLEFCGGKFNTQSLQTEHGVARSTTTPFRFDFRAKTAANADGLAGFNLRYSQVPC